MVEIDGVSGLDSDLGWWLVVERKKGEENVSCGIERDDSAVGML